MTHDERPARPAVSVVLPIRNGDRWLRAVLDAVIADAGDLPLEIIAVDDGSQDTTPEILGEFERRGRVIRVPGPGRGAAAALNAGIRAARAPLIAQIDQDVVVAPGWLARLVQALVDQDVAAAQGCYVNDPGAPLLARVTALDLQQRYETLATETDHVCTGNVVYRATALHQAGLFDETLGYGYDNDMSYRLRALGHRLVFCRDAHSVHHWRAGPITYCRQQYGFGYGRLDVIARHPSRIGGDMVSPPAMMVRPMVTALALTAAASAAAMGMSGLPWQPLAVLAAVLYASLLGERLVSGARAAARFGDRAAWLFPLVHALRDLAWVAAVVVWSARRVARVASVPGHSMRPRAAAARPDASAPFVPAHAPRVLAVVPAHNEAQTLPLVVGELRAHLPHADILVVDDGSDDATATLLPTLGIRWIRLPERMGVGSAMRAALIFASRLGHDVVVRLDGDGQHRAEAVACLLEPIRRGAADIVLGSRYAGPNVDAVIAAPLASRLLGACLSVVTGRPVTDPTSGFCAFGPRAIERLVHAHPTGYPEPELLLEAARLALRVTEVPVVARARQGGQSSLTPVRVLAAGARVLLALVVVPLRSGE